MWFGKSSEQCKYSEYSFADVGRDAIRPVVAGAIPGSVKAFLNAPLVKGKKCTEEQVRELVDDMLQETLKYLPEGWKN